MIGRCRVEGYDYVSLLFVYIFKKINFERKEKNGWWLEEGLIKGYFYLWEGVCDIFIYWERELMGREIWVEGVDREFVIFYFIVSFFKFKIGG